MREMLLIVGNPEEYQTFLESRPAVMEEKAIDLVCEMCLKYKYDYYLFSAWLFSRLRSKADCKKKIL